MKNKIELPAPTTLHDAAIVMRNLEEKLNELCQIRDEIEDNLEPIHFESFSGDFYKSLKRLNKSIKSLDNGLKLMSQHWV